MLFNKKKSIFLSFFLLSIGLYAQSLEDEVKKIKDEIGEVGTEKLTFNQTFKNDPTKPYKVIYEKSVTDTKGKQTVEEWEFNLADLDKNTVRWLDASKKLSVIAKAFRGQKFIKYSKNGNIEGYTDDIEILAKNIDNARNLENAIKNAIPLAKIHSDSDFKITGKTLNDLLNLLFKISGEVKAGETTYNQKFENAGDYPDRIKQTIEEFGKNGLLHTYINTWSLGDLNEPTLKLQMSNRVAKVEGGTKRGLRWISSMKDGKNDDNEKEINIYITDPDQGKFLLNLFQQLIPMGEAEIKKRLPNLKGVEALNAFAMLNNKIIEDKKETEQTVTNNCVSLLTKRVNGSNRSEVFEHAFNFGDLNEKSCALEISNNTIELKISTQNKVDWIQEKKDGLLKGYDNKISFLMGSIEDGRRYELLLPAAVEYCRQTPQAKDFVWLQKSLGATESQENAVTQKMELQANDTPYKWKFTRLTTSSKKTSEEIYEFGLADIDSKAISIKISNKKVFIELQTKYKQKIISYYKDGKPSYEPDFSLEFADIETAKVAKETLVALVEKCK